MRHVALLLTALAITACSSGGDGNTDENVDAGPPRVTIIKVSGKVQYHPQELAWRAKQGGDLLTPPSIKDAVLNVEDAIKAQSNLPALKTVPVVTTGDHPTEGTFEAEGVDVKGTTLALVASVKKDSDPDFVFSGYGLGKPPFQEVMTDLPVYIVSKAFLTHLATVVGRQLDTMLEEGMVIGGASSEDHKTGVEGAKLVRLYGTGASARVEEITENIFYLNDDLSAVVNDRATTKSGTWIRLNAGSAATYTMLDKDATSFQQPNTRLFKDRLNGSRAGTALSVFFEKLSD